MGEPVCTGPGVAVSHRTGLHSAEDGSTAPGMVAHGWGWPHMAGGDGGNVLRSPYITASPWASVRSAAIHSSRCCHP
jgi:hypothetical protein